MTRRDHMHGEVGKPNGPVLCPNCNIKSFYVKCGRCGHEFSEPWLRSMEEYEKRLHIGSGRFEIPLPTMAEIASRKARTQ